MIDGLINSQDYNNHFDWTVSGSVGLRFCATDRGQSSELIAPRVRALDRNNDGVITPPEWDGSEVAFANRDSNGDGVISGQELRAEGRRAGRRANDYDFDALDINNNRIERREWRGGCSRIRAAYQTTGCLPLTSRHRFPPRLRDDAIRGEFLLDVVL